MDYKESLNVFRRFWKWTKSHCVCSDRNSASILMKQRILDVEKAKRTRTAALNECAERLCASQQARNDAVLERLGCFAQDGKLPSPQSPVTPRENRFPVRRRGTSLFLKKTDVENTKRNQRRAEGLKRREEELFWRQVHLGSQMAVLACDMAKLADDRDKSLAPSISCGSSLSSVDTHTPRRLRDIPLIVGSPVELSQVLPSPPTRPGLLSRGVSRLPVLLSKVRGAYKKSVQTASQKKAALQETKSCQDSPVPAPQPPVAAKKTLLWEPVAPNSPVTPKEIAVIKPLAPKPQVGAKGTAAIKPLAPKPPAGPPLKKTGNEPWRVMRPTQPVRGAGKKTANEKHKERAIVEHQPLARPAESLSLFFTLLSSDDWKKKMEGLKIIQALAQHHSTTLSKIKLHEVCLVLAKEVNNLRSIVACAAINTLDELYVHLHKALDPEVEITGRSLLLKLAQTTNKFVHQQVNFALDSMIKNCSHSRTVTTLLNTGLSHRCVAVRGSTAEHLHQVANSLGVDYIFTAGNGFTERFLTAISTMSVDAAPEVRHHALPVLEELALHKDFLNLWTTIIPEKERRPLDKILRKSKK